MSRKCQVCGKEIEPFAEYWIREPDKFDDKGVMIKRGRAMPFCSLGCIFGWAGGEIRRQKRVRHQPVQEPLAGGDPGGCRSKELSHQEHR